MLPWLAPWLSSLWGPLRLLGSHLFLLGLGTVSSALLVWLILPRLWDRLPRDRGRLHAQQGGAAKGKPTGAGVLLVLLVVPVLFVVLPFSVKIFEIVGCLVLAMLTGYGDDRSAQEWGQWRKATLDLAVAVLTSLALCQGHDTHLWLPVLKQTVTVGPLAYVALSTVVLWFTLNATNCTDGVDGLAGSLTTLSLFNLGGFLYAVIGHREVAKYLLVPHDPAGANWAILLFTVAGGVAAYLWYNAEPSQVLMGDAGSRFLGLLVGVAVMASGNPLLVLVVAPVVLVNGGTGLGKLVLLRLFGRLGLDVRPPHQVSDPAELTRQHPAVRLLHSVRFPLHDHCRKNLHWSNPQVLVRFLLLQGFLTPLLLALLVKVR